MKTNQIAWGQNEYRWNTAYPGANACQRQNGPQPDGYLGRYHGRQEGTERTARQCQCIPARACRSPAPPSRWGALAVEEQDIRSDILAGLIADKGGIATYTASSASEGLRNVCRISGLTAFGSAEFYVSSGR
jgi:hypothetical protein